MISFFKQLFLNQRLFLAVSVVVLCFVLSFLFEGLLIFSESLFVLLLASAVADLVLLFLSGNLQGAREAPERFSNGDQNKIIIHLTSTYNFRVQAEVIDEVPAQFQLRNVQFKISITRSGSAQIPYFLRPVRRGVYTFGAVNTFVRSPIGFFKRRLIFSGDKDVPVYPSFMQMRAFEFLAISDRLQRPGIKRIRRLGHNMEFELVKDYVMGDDVRTINWKATARRAHLMVNHYQDERSQQVYCMINKGRVMQMPFNGMSLLDYSINASLALTNVALRKYDKAGFITFQDTVSNYLPASRKDNQINRILQFLYNQKTGYRESDYSSLYSFVSVKITQRSLLLLFTNFESIHTMRRQLPLLAKLARHHLLVVIFFENTELTSVAEKPAIDLKEIYYKTIAEKFIHEKKKIVRELAQRGIQSVLTAPENLTVKTINKYLELKSRGLI